VGRIGSGVRVSVSFRQKYPPGSVLRCPTAAENVVMTKGVVSGGEFDLRLRRITSSPSQTIRPCLVFSTKIPAAFGLTMSYGSRKRSYDQGGCVRKVFDLRLRRITSSPSQTIRPCLVRRTATDAAVSTRLDACRRSRLYFSHFATYGLQYCRPVCSV